MNYQEFKEDVKCAGMCAAAFAAVIAGGVAAHFIIRPVVVVAVDGAQALADKADRLIYPNRHP